MNAVSKVSTQLLRGDGSLVQAVRPPAEHGLELDAKSWGFTVSLQDETLLQSTQAPQDSAHHPQRTGAPQGPLP